MPKSTCRGMWSPSETVWDGVSIRAQQAVSHAMQAMELRTSEKLAAVPQKGRSCAESYCRSFSAKSSRMQHRLWSLFLMRVRGMAKLTPLRVLALPAADSLMSQRHKHASLHFKYWKV